MMMKEFSFPGMPGTIRPCHSVEEIAVLAEPLFKSAGEHPGIAQKGDLAKTAILNNLAISIAFRERLLRMVLTQDIHEAGNYWHLSISQMFMGPIPDDVLHAIGEAFFRTDYFQLPGSGRIPNVCHLAKMVKNPATTVNNGV